MQLLFGLVFFLLAASPALALEPTSYSPPPGKVSTTPDFLITAPEPSAWCNVYISHCVDQVACDMQQGADYVAYSTAGWVPCNDGYSVPWNPSYLQSGTQEEASGGLIKGQRYYYAFDTRSTTNTAYTVQYPSIRAGLTEAMDESVFLGASSGLGTFVSDAFVQIAAVVALAAGVFFAYAVVRWLIRIFMQLALGKKVSMGKYSTLKEAYQHGATVYGTYDKKKKTWEFEAYHYK